MVFLLCSSWRCVGEEDPHINYISSCLALSLSYWSIHHLIHAIHIVHFSLKYIVSRNYNSETDINAIVNTCIVMPMDFHYSHQLPRTYPEQSEYAPEVALLVKWRLECLVAKVPVHLALPPLPPPR